MSKIHIYYKTEIVNKSLFSRRIDLTLSRKKLKIKIDDKLLFEVKQGNVIDIELENGKHNIKTNLGSKEIAVGYVDKEILVSNDKYFIYKTTRGIFNKGNLIEVFYNSENEFKKYVKKHIKKCKIILKYYRVIILSIGIIFILLLKYL